MNLAQAISQLLEAGKVVVMTEVRPFSEEDLGATLLILKECHALDALEMPEKAPDFLPEAAMWGALFAYRSMQLILLRDLGPEAVEVLLPAYPGGHTPQAAYSVDLCLRHLPDLRNLAGGLAPGDPLVTRLEVEAHRWPFSSVGLSLDEEYDLRPILDHASLRLAYVDRVIAQKDRRRSEDPRINPFIQAALGDYAQKFWPGFQAIDTIHNP